MGSGPEVGGVVELPRSNSRRFFLPGWGVCPIVLTSNAPFNFPPAISPATTTHPALGPRSPPPSSGPREPTLYPIPARASSPIFYEPPPTRTPQSVSPALALSYSYSPPPPFFAAAYSRAQSAQRATKAFVPNTRECFLYAFKGKRPPQGRGSYNFFLRAHTAPFTCPFNVEGLLSSKKEAARRARITIYHHPAHHPLCRSSKYPMVFEVGFFTVTCANSILWALRIKALEIPVAARVAFGAR